MNRWMKTRNGQILLLIIILMSVLGIRLFVLTVLQYQDWDTASRDISTKSIYTSAPRGRILDRYGRLLAGNISSFTVQFSAGDLESKEINKISSNLIKVLERNGDEYDDNFPIIMENGKFYYTYQKEIEEWLSSQNMPSNLTAEQAFEELKSKNNIEESMDKYEAQVQLQTVYNIYPPISVRNFQYLRDLDKQSFLGRFKLDLDLTAKEAFYELRDQFEIDPNLSDEEARKIMIIRNHISSQGYRKYMPAKIAYNVSDETVVILKEKSEDLKGVEVVAESVRYYPNNNLASHVLGYLGKISESDKEKYVDELGYNANDMIGKEGIEKVEESTLKGKDGVQRVQVNANGEKVKVIEETEPEKGKDVYLTLDLELQKIAEETLKETLTKLQVGGTYESPMGLGNYKFNKTLPNANTGAVVVLDVATSDVLAMASYPNFDPNLFVTGISKEDWNSLQSKNPRDKLAPLPLYNVAALTAVQPGSTFKMVTATAGLENGLDPNRKLYANGVVNIGTQSYGCLIWNDHRGVHGYINLMEALEVSCNYYFFDVAAGKDFYNNKSLGLNGPMGIENISKYANQYGLGLDTGIEITERVVPVPSEERKIKQKKATLRNVLISNAEIYFKSSVLKDKELLEKNIDTIVSWTEENPKRRELIKRMSNIGIKDEKCEAVADLCKFDYFNNANWTTGDVLNIAIGQGENAYTPLQMANYVATIGNKGVHNKVSLIRGLEGKGIIEREKGNKIDVSDQSHLDAIIDGMKRVVYGQRGSLKILSSLPVEVAVKTGTAEREGKIDPPDEAEYIKSNLQRIDSKLSWDAVEAEIKRLMKEYPDTYTSRDIAVRRAVINLSNGSVTYAKIDAYKADYDNFAWVVGLAPADDPKIAIAVLLVQGNTSTYTGPMVRDIIAKYLELDKTYTDYDLNTNITQ
ncbi:penicillin-binding transpeptidase domain-containing protein [Anaerovorax odorimutans]|uniref:penicillin-binding transpeptidase domain-containing protein n=1 Tax=Anaerovorax odorimutans TaxID=109327 RepID=UPI00041B98FC|nr:penicillin-binding transpeptidase domain-containing protein [Anaerovorax odorimutans]